MVILPIILFGGIRIADHLWLTEVRFPTFAREVQALPAWLYIIKRSRREVMSMIA